MKTFLKFLITALSAWAQCALAANLTQRDVHIDVPLSNVAVKAFQSGNMVGPTLFPIVPVDNQSGVYYIIDRAAWMKIPASTLRAPKTSPRRVEFTVSSDLFACNNYALAGENALEVLSHADRAIQVRNNTAMKVANDLAVDMEVRIAGLVTSITNIGSGVSLAGGAKWSDYINSDPISDVTSGRSFIRSQTGFIPNVLVLDYDTRQIVKRHPVLLDMYKYTQGGFLSDTELAEVFEVDRILIGNAIRNSGQEGQAASMTNVWGNVALLAYVDNAPPSMQTATAGLAFRWTPEGIPAPMQASIYMDPDPGKKTEIVEVGYYQQEKIIAPNLMYLVGSTL